MEHINRIELQGHVGTIRYNEHQGRRVVNFSLATELLYKSRDGHPVSELTWHNIVAWDSKEIEDLDQICKGAPVYVCGRLRAYKYTSADGVDKTIYEVTANRLHLVREDKTPQ